MSWFSHMGVSMLDLIAFDADDTLWHNENLYTGVIDRFAEIVAPFAGPEQAKQTLHDVEMRNLSHYGYGIKAFTLSLIEAAIEVSHSAVPASSIQALIALTRDQLVAHVHLIDGVEDVVRMLAQEHSLIMITKGDLFEQEAKVARSGMRGYFKHVEIVSNKTPEIYAALLARYNVPADRFLMIGNAMRSDILPVLELGGQAVYIPYAGTWAHEHAEPPQVGRERFHEIEHIGLLPALIDELLDRKVG